MDTDGENVRSASRLSTYSGRKRASFTGYLLDPNENENGQRVHQAQLQQLLAEDQLSLADRDGRRRSTNSVRSSLRRHSTCSASVLPQASDDDDLEGRCCSRRCVIIPSSENLWYSGWEVFIFTLVGLSCYLVPMEVVLQRHGQRSYFTLVSYFIDISFAVDICLNFFTAYEQPGPLGEMTWEESKWLIARRYCALPLSGSNNQSGWFWIDLVATGPRVLSLLLTKSHVASVKAMAMLRALRLLRFLRLHKIERMSHYLLRMNVKLGLSLSVIEIMKSTLVVSLAVHWMACLWVGVESVHWKGIFFQLSGNKDTKSWLSVMIDSYGDPCSPSCAEDGLCVYMLALYWCVITITSVGFGDFCPQNHTEYVISVFCTMGLALVWAYVIATVVSIVSSFKASSYDFNQQMDELNNMCASRNVPQQLRVQLRDYMATSRHIPKQMAQIKLLSSRLSVGLQDKVAEVTRGRFLNKVWWAIELPGVAKLELVHRMQPRFYSPKESIMLLKTMLFVRDGWVKVNGLRLLGHGDRWGEVDVLLQSEELVRDHLQSESFVDAVTLTQESIREVCLLFPGVDSRIRRAQVRCATFRAFVITAQSRQGRTWWSRKHMGMVVSTLKPGRGSFANSAPLTRKERFVDRLGMELSKVEGWQEKMKKQLDELEEELDIMAAGTKGRKAR